MPYVLAAAHAGDKHVSIRLESISVLDPALFFSSVHLFDKDELGGATSLSVYTLPLFLHPHLQLTVT